jgi:hypothetical protein
MCSPLPVRDVQAVPHDRLEAINIELLAEVTHPFECRVTGSEYVLLRTPAIRLGEIKTFYNRFLLNSYPSWHSGIVCYNCCIFHFIGALFHAVEMHS